MESNPFTLVVGWRLQPEHAERLGKWIMEVYQPLMVKSGVTKGIDRYQIVKEGPDYLRNISFFHYGYFGALDDAYKSPVGRDLVNDIATWGARREAVWGAYYQLIKGFRNDGEAPWAKAEKGAEEAPIIHLEGYNLSPQAERVRPLAHQMGI